MGASTFFNVGTAPSAKLAFAEVAAQARYNFGHAGYTGTIAEKSEFKMASSEVFATRELAEAFAEDKMEDDNHFSSDKWGPAACVEFKNGSQTHYLFFGWASS